MRISIRFLAAAAVVSLAGAVAACSSAATTGIGSARSSGQPVHGGTLKVALYSDIQNINPITSEDPVAQLMWGNWWQYAVYATPNGQSLQPMLATSWSITSDYKTYTFQIRPGVEFSDGEALTAEDVAWSWEYMISQSAAQMNFLAPRIASITAPGPLTVRVVFKTPYPYFLDDVSGFEAVIMPKALVEKEGWSAYLRHPVGTGPFVLTSWQRGASIQVTRNPHYWQHGLPYLDGITYLVMPDDQSRITAVESGTADVATQIPYNEVRSLSSRPGMYVANFPQSIDWNMVLNTLDPPLNNVLVRRAISLAINRAELEQAALYGNGVAAKTFLPDPAGLTFADPALNLYPYDPAKAKALLAQAGVRNLHLTLLLEPGQAEAATGAVIQADLAAVGIHLSLDTVSETSWLDDLTSQKFQLTTSFWQDISPNPINQIQYTMVPDYAAGCCKAFWSSLNDPAVIAAAQAATTAVGSHAALQPIFNKAQIAEAQAADPLPLYNDVTTPTLMSSRVHGFAENPYDGAYFAGIWLAS